MNKNPMKVHWEIIPDGDRWTGKLVINGQTVLRTAVSDSKDGIRTTIARAKSFGANALVREID